MATYREEHPLVSDRGRDFEAEIDISRRQVLTAGYWRGLMIVALVLGVAWINLSRLAADEISYDLASEAPMVGFLAPDFTLTTTDGDKVQLSTLRGKPVILNFWATWCPPCRAEMPALEALWQQYDSGGVLVLGIDQGESAVTVERFARGVVGTTFPLLLDTQREIGAEYGVRALPTTFFIDAQGRVQDIKVGGPLNIATLMGGVDRIIQ